MVARTKMSVKEVRVLKYRVLRTVFRVLSVRASADVCVACEQRAGSARHSLPGAARCGPVTFQHELLSA